MTWAGSMRRWARRMATRRISWTDQRIRSAPPGEPDRAFWGRGRVRVVADGRQHGEGQHDERDVPVPAMPGAGLVVVETELGLGGLEGVLDRPALPFDSDQRLDPGAGRAPGGEEGELAIGEAAADQKAPRPQAGAGSRCTRRPRGRPVPDRPSRRAARPWCRRRPRGAARRAGRGPRRSPRPCRRPQACRSRS